MSITIAHGEEHQKALRVQTAARTHLLHARRILAAPIGIAAEIAAQPTNHRGAVRHTNHQEVVDLSIPEEDHAAAEAAVQDHQLLEEVVAGPVAINRAQNLTSIFYGI